MRNITEIIVHCTATPAGRTVSAAEVDRWHRQRGFESIGYHYLIGLDGTIEAGRPEERMGAHCAGHNSNSIGVCYVGGCDRLMKPADTRTGPQRLAIERLLKSLRVRYPQARIISHRDLAATACPAFDATSEYAGI